MTTVYEIDYKGKMNEENYQETVLYNEIIHELIKYVVAGT